LADHIGLLKRTGSARRANGLAAACAVAADATKAAKQAARAEEERREPVLPVWWSEGRGHEVSLPGSCDVSIKKD